MAAEMTSQFLHGINEEYIDNVLRSGVSQQIVILNTNADKILSDLEGLKKSLHSVVGMIDTYAVKINRTVKKSGNKPKALPPTLPEERERFSHNAGEIIMAERKKFFQTEIDSFLGTIQALLLELERPFRYETRIIQGERMTLRNDERGMSRLYNLQQEIIILNDMRVLIYKILAAIDKIKKEIGANASWVSEVLEKTGEFKPVKRGSFFSRLFGRKGAN